MKSTPAKDIKISILEMEVMYREHQRAYAEYSEQKKTATEISMFNRIPVKNSYNNFEHYLEIVPMNLAEVSHGDVVIMEGLNEIRRVKGNYTERLFFVSK